MRSILIFVAFALSGTVSAALADTYVRGHVRQDGTYVQPHYRSNPDSSKFNNYSAEGNTNPYTGESGTVDPYAYGSTGSAYTNSNSSPSIYGPDH